MQFSLIALAGFAAVATAQTYTGAIASPTAAAPAGCATTYPGPFEISVLTSPSKEKRSNALMVSLKDGLLTDSQGRIGYIASNYQFQFDFGGQAGEIYNSGFSVCANKSLALGGSAVWYECLSGTFYNIYDENWAPQCKASFLDVVDVSNGVISTVTGSVAGTATILTAASSNAALDTTTDGQLTAATTTTPVSSSVVVVTSVSSVTSSAALISSLPDHQPQGPTSTSAVVSSVVVASSTTITPTPSMTSVALISSISDHQIQAPTTTTAVSVTAYTGAAAMPTLAAQMLLAAAGAAVALL